MSDKVWDDFAALPKESQKLAADFIAFLRDQHASGKKRRAVGRSISAEPFIGMWRDREDMEDSRTWVRATRNREWSTPDG